MSSFKDFLLWYNNIDVVPTLAAMQKMIAFYHDKNIDLLKLGCTLPKMANVCLHKSTDAKIYPFTERDKDPLEKIREENFSVPSIVFTRKAVVDETFIRKSANKCKSIVGIDSSQLYPFYIVNPCLPVFIRLGISIQKRVDSHLGKTRSAAWKILSCPIFN